MITIHVLINIDFQCDGSTIDTMLKMMYIYSDWTYTQMLERDSILQPINP